MILIKRIFYKKGVSYYSLMPNRREEGGLLGTREFARDSINMVGAKWHLLSGTSTNVGPDRLSIQSIIWV